MKTSRTDATGSRDRRQPADDETTSGAAPRTTLSENARTVLAARYLRRDRRGDVTETPEQMFTRVARAVAAAEERFAGGRERRRYEERFLDALLRLDFLPNSPTLYQTAWQWGLKGVTLFRYGSKGEQVLNLGVEETPDDREHFARCDPGECRL